MATRKLALSGVLILLTCINFVSTWPIRDHELVVRVKNISNEQPPDLYDEKLLCTVLPDCFRISHKLIIGVVKTGITQVVEFVNQFVGSTVTDSPNVAGEIARNLGPYLVLRMLFLVGFIFAIYQYFKSWWIVGVIGNCMLIWWSGLPVRAITAVYLWFLDIFGKTEFHHDLLTWHISRNSTIFVLEYDLLALLAVLTIPLILHWNTIHQRLLVQFCIGLLLAVTFENLAIVYIVGAVWGEWKLRKRLPIRAVSIIAAGWAIPIVVLVINTRLNNASTFPIVCPEDGSRCLSIPELGYAMNSSFRPLIYRLLVVFLLLPFLLGISIGVLLKRFKALLNWSKERRTYMVGTIIGLLLSYSIGYFGSALPTEFGRQSLGAQFILILYGMSIGQRFRIRDVKTQRIHSRPI